MPVWHNLRESILGDALYTPRQSFHLRMRCMTAKPFPQKACPTTSMSTHCSVITLVETPWKQVVQRSLFRSLWGLSPVMWRCSGEPSTKTVLVLAQSTHAMCHVLTRGFKLYPLRVTMEHFICLWERFSKSVKNVKLKWGRLRGPSCSPSAFIEDIKRSSEGERSAFYCSGGQGRNSVSMPLSHLYFLSLCNLQCATTCAIFYMLSYFRPLC